MSYPITGTILVFKPVCRSHFVTIKPNSTTMNRILSVEFMREMQERCRLESIHIHADRFTFGANECTLIDQITKPVMHELISNGETVQVYIVFKIRPS